MTTQLPNIPQSTTTTFSYISSAVDLTPQLGGPSQRLARLADRMQIGFNLRPLIYSQAVTLIESLIQGLTGKVRAYIPQPGLNTNAGSNVTFANAAAITASTTVIALTGLNAGYTIVPGQYLNVMTNGVQYLYQSIGSVTASGSGTATLNIQPPLKAQPNAGDVVSFSAPVIEGFLQGNQQSWTLSLVQSVGVTYTIREAQ